LAWLPVAHALWKFGVYLASAPGAGGFRVWLEEKWVFRRKGEV